MHLHVLIMCARFLDFPGRQWYHRTDWWDWKVSAAYLHHPIWLCAYRVWKWPHGSGQIQWHAMDFWQRWTRTVGASSPQVSPCWTKFEYTFLAYLATLWAQPMKSMHSSGCLVIGLYVLEMVLPQLFSMMPACSLLWFFSQLLFAWWSTWHQVAPNTSSCWEASQPDSHRCVLWLVSHVCCGWSRCWGLRIWP